MDSASKAAILDSHLMEIETKFAQSVMCHVQPVLTMELLETELDALPVLGHMIIDIYRSSNALNPVLMDTINHLRLYAVYVLLLAILVIVQPQIAQVVIFRVLNIATSMKISALKVVHLVLQMLELNVKSVIQNVEHAKTLQLSVLHA